MLTPVAVRTAVSWPARRAAWWSVVNVSSTSTTTSSAWTARCRSRTRWRRWRRAGDQAPQVNRRRTRPRRIVLGEDDLVSREW